MRRAVASAIAAAAMVLLAACTSAPAGSTSGGTSTARGPAPLVPAGLQGGTLRLGYTLNLADAPALAGLQNGYFTTSLRGVTLQPSVFPSGTAEAAALQEGQIDAAYLDPVDAVRAWQATRGQIAIIAGAASGGAELVVRKGITRASQLAHAAVAAPAGGAQQAALSWWLHQQGVPSPGPGHVTMTSTYLARALKTGHLAGAWEPAPQDTAMVAAGGHVLVNEASLWPGGRFSTAVLVVSRKYLAAHPATVTGLLQAHIRTEMLLTTSPATARMAVTEKLATTGGTGSLAALLPAFAQVTFTSDPLASTILTEAKHAATAGILAPITSLKGIYDLTELNKLLTASGQHKVTSG